LLFKLGAACPKFGYQEAYEITKLKAPLLVVNTKPSSLQAELWKGLEHL